MVQKRIIPLIKFRAVRSEWLHFTQTKWDSMISKHKIRNNVELAKTEIEEQIAKVPKALRKKTPSK